MDRDLTRVDLWEESLRRSRDRRARAAAQPPFELPARGVSLGAALAIAGVPATAFAAAKVLGGGEDAAATRVAIELPGQQDAVGKAVGRAGAIDEPAKPAIAREQKAAPAKAAPAKPVAAKPAVASSGTPTTKLVTGTAQAASVTTVAHTARRSGGGVAALQRKLGMPVDGDFGPRTERALKRWQRAHGLTADGVAGPQTREALRIGSGNDLKRKHAARRHARHHAAQRASHSGGSGVRGLQQALGVGVDGVFGSGTEQALRRWQRAHGLTADGVAGPATRQALGLGPGPALKRKRSHPGSSGGGGSSSTVQRVIAAANGIAGLPYRYGGGHGSFNDTGYDCSGSVSYALHGGGLLSSPLDSSALMSYGAPGPGRHITIYANPGHVYMTIDGRRFDTSARGENGSRWSGTQRGSAGYVLRHPPGY